MHHFGTCSRAGLLTVATILAACNGKIDTSAESQGAASTQGGAAAATPASPASSDVLLDVALTAVTTDATSIYVVDVMGQVIAIRKSDHAQRVLVPSRGDRGLDVEGLAACGDHIYWTELMTGRIARVATEGGEVETIASDRRRPWQITCDDTLLVWAEQGDGSTGDGARVGSLALPFASGSAPMVLADDQTFGAGVALTDDAIFFSVEDRSRGVEVRRVARTGGPVTTTAAIELEPFQQLATNGTFVGLGGQSAGTFVFPVSGGPLVHLPGSGIGGNAVAFAGADIAFATRGDVDATVHLYSESPGSTVPHEVGATAYPDAISILAAVSAASDASGAYFVDTWYGRADAKPHSVIHHLPPP